MHSFSLILCLVLPALHDMALAIPLDPRDNYTGVGGHSSGGSVTHSGGLVNLMSFNAGDAGPANSGDAGGTQRGRGREGQSNAYSGAGGDSNGGSVSDTTGVINLFSGNAGGAGDAISGSAGDGQGHRVSGCNC